MLVLSRKSNQSIQIGDNITVKVIGIAGNRVRLGIDAPGNVDILRGELIDLQDQWLDCPVESEEELELVFA